MRNKSISASRPQSIHLYIYSEFVLCFFRKYDIIPLLVDVAQAAVKEKVIRVVVATFRNLITKAPTQNLPAMLVANLLPFSQNLFANRKFSDEDIVEDVKWVRDELVVCFGSLT